MSAEGRSKGKLTPLSPSPVATPGRNRLCLQLRKRFSNARKRSLARLQTVFAHHLLLQLSGDTQPTFQTRMFNNRGKKVNSCSINAPVSLFGLELFQRSAAPALRG